MELNFVCVCVWLQAYGVSIELQLYKVDTIYEWPLLQTNKWKEKFVDHNIKSAGKKVLE